MSDTITSARLEPNVGPVPPADIVEAPRTIVPAAEPSSRAVVAEPAQDRSPMDRDRYEQLARLEDKTSRIEEKYARSEAMMQRVADKIEIATARMGEVALQSDLAAIRGEVGVIGRRIKGLPGVSGLVVTAVLTAILTAVLMVAIIRYMPGLLGR